jgi:hypothetical protein
MVLANSILLASYPQARQSFHILLHSLQTLADPECYHEFCRLLMRLKSNYQLGELIRLDNYPTFLELVVKFTVSSLQVRLHNNIMHDSSTINGGLHIHSCLY